MVVVLNCNTECRLYYGVCECVVLPHGETCQWQCVQHTTCAPILCLLHWCSWTGTVYFTVYLQCVTLLLSGLQRFIASNPAKTKELLFTMINSPELSSLLCPIFTPNAASGDFVNMYDRVAETFSSSTSISFSLLSKVWLIILCLLSVVHVWFVQFDIHDWLNQSSPSYSECKRMIDCIGQALAVCGREPSSDTAMVFGVCATVSVSVNCYLNLWFCFEVVPRTLASFPLSQISDPLWWHTADATEM